MTQAELNRAVASATGESVSRVSRQGFVLLTTQPVERDFQVVDWDELDAGRTSYLPQRQRCD